MTDAVAVAQQVLAADSAPGPTLSLAPGMPAVTVDTPVAEARRNYMRLAALIHPDKLKGSFEKATEAFQLLVRAFEAFVNPVSRKKAFAAAPKTKSVLRKSTKPSTTSSPKGKPSKKKSRSEPAEATATKKTARKKPARKAASESEEDEDVSSESDMEDEEEPSPSDEEEEFHFSDDDKAEPVVSNNRSPIGQLRSGEDHVMTIIGCPNCRSRWEPDTRQQYSLFMGEWGKKVHCQLCLLVFGSATALHNCPHCQASFDYDASMYDSVINCHRCKHRIGFPYYPVSQHLIDQVKLDEWRARKEAERAQERERRHRERHGGDDPEAAARAQMQMWVGTCVVDEECPLCHARVRRNHKQHVETCATTHGQTPAGGSPDSGDAPTKTTTPRTVRAGGPKAVAKVQKTEKKAPVAKKTAVATKPVVAPPRKKAAATAKKAPAGKKAKRRGSSSDDDDDEDEDSFSDDESDVSESSFDEDDDDVSSDDE